MVLEKSLLNIELKREGGGEKESREGEERRQRRRGLCLQKNPRKEATFKLLV